MGSTLRSQASAHAHDRERALSDNQVVSEDVGPAMENVAADIGIHDFSVGPGASIESEQGVIADFLASRAES